MNVYDFDKTIYRGDSTIDFYLWCLKRKPLIIFLLPIQFWGFLMYKIGIKDKAYFKEKFYVFLRFINVSNFLINKFWNEKINGICYWYIKKKQKSDVIITASPEFLIYPLKEKLDVGDVIASIVDSKTGKLLSKNCYGEEKVVRFKKLYKNKKINNFYSDSKSDLPMAKIAKKSFLVNIKNDTIDNFFE